LGKNGLIGAYGFFQIENSPLPFISFEISNAFANEPIKSKLSIRQEDKSFDYYPQKFDDLDEAKEFCQELFEIQVAEMFFLTFSRSR
jgi:hypothetical protein